MPTPRHGLRTPAYEFEGARNASAWESNSAPLSHSISQTPARSSCDAVGASPSRSPRRFATASPNLISARRRKRATLSLMPAPCPARCPAPCPARRPWRGSPRTICRAALVRLSSCSLLPVPPLRRTPAAVPRRPPCPPAARPPKRAAPGGCPHRPAPGVAEVQFVHPPRRQQPQQVAGHLRQVEKASLCALSLSMATHGRPWRTRCL